METMITLHEVKAKLRDGGYGGLLISGECGCTLDDLAPCGECQQDDGEEFINNCDPGYVFTKPDDPDNAWMVRLINQEPTVDEWNQLERSL